jgi:hypothetical protein
MTEFLLTACALGLLSSPASAQTINLVCGGTFSQYDPERLDAKVSPTATTVDLERKLLSTPVGQYLISRIEDTKIVIYEERQDFSVVGSLDRLTGKMEITWQRPAERAKLLAGLSSKIAGRIELQCSASNRLF